MRRHRTRERMTGSGRTSIDGSAYRLAKYALALCK